MSYQSRLAKIEKAAMPKAPKIETHLIPKRVNMSQEEAIKRYESRTGKKVNANDQLVIVLTYVEDSEDLKPLAS